MAIWGSKAPKHQNDLLLRTLGIFGGLALGLLGNMLYFFYASQLGKSQNDLWQAITSSLEDPRRSMRPNQATGLMSWPIPCLTSSPAGRLGSRKDVENDNMGSMQKNTTQHSATVFSFITLMHSSSPALFPPNCIAQWNKMYSKRFRLYVLTKNR